MHTFVKPVEQSGQFKYTQKDGNVVINVINTMLNSNRLICEFYLFIMLFQDFSIGKSEVA